MGEAVNGRRRCRGSSGDERIPDAGEAEGLEILDVGGGEFGDAMQLE